MDKDKNMDKFINIFSQKVNLLIKYEYNKEINTNKHHLLFNDLLYNKFQV